MDNYFHRRVCKLEITYMYYVQGKANGLTLKEWLRLEHHYIKHDINFASAN